MAKYKELDHWSLKAQKEGYPARSVYKLKEIDERFRIFKPAREGSPGQIKILDIGAAPGSWSLYVLRKFGARVFLAAADLSPLSRQYDKGLFDGDNFFFIQGDITLPETREILLGKGPYDVVLSDAAPATSGNRSVDSLRSQALAEEVLYYAETGLAPGGALAVKVFQGGDTVSVLKRVRELFDTGKSYKPEACRSNSFETYYLGLGRK
ncbi:SAM-dependent methyltransferase [Breznakiella homolactica]|uniref:Ribosomal RNA large subunit methyltransferase E n=1 Tax=Breznakiella homolactica TaxID=2798577 RepID=A0A7T8BB75_9SPIR|nr:RlmE family RNA methyltransferase [Breznakiella homolactica]QQO09740.1 RlmE family RNA methyltransferase [Breznakiella homolactica]